MGTVEKLTHIPQTTAMPQTFVSLEQCDGRLVASRHVAQHGPAEPGLGSSLPAPSHLGPAPGSPMV